MTDHDRINDEAAARLQVYASEREALPQRPDPAITSHVTDSTMRTLVIASFSERQMDDYGLACYRAGAARTQGEAPVVRAAESPGDLVPLANGRSVDLGGRWTMPK